MPYIVPQRLYRVQILTRGIWQDASGPLPMRSAQTMRAFLVRGTTSRSLFHG